MILDAKGNPFRSAAARAEVSSYDALVELGFTDAGDHLTIDKATLRQMASERARDLAVSSVPSTPRWMLRTMGGAVEKTSLRYPSLSFEQLRELRETIPILQPIHQARMYAARRIAKAWDGQEGAVGWRVVHKDHNKAMKEPPEYIRPYIARATAILERPAHRYGCRTTSDLVGLLLEDLMTLNHPVAEVIHSRVDPSRVVQLRAVDGALLWPTLKWVEKYKLDNPSWAGQAGFGVPLEAHNEVEVLSEIIHLDLTSAEYVLVQDNIPLAVYPRGKFIVAPIMNRTDVRSAGYQRSNVEMAINWLAAFVNAFDYNATLFTHGMMTEFALGIPAESNPADVRAFIEHLRLATQGVARAHQPPVLPLFGGSSQIQKIDLKPPPGDMGFETWISLNIAVGACGCYRMDPTTIGAKPWDGGSRRSIGGERDRSDEIANAKEEGLEGDIGHIVESILTPFVQRCHPDLKVLVEWGHVDPKVVAQIYSERSRVDMTRNQVRLARGDSPEGYWLSRAEYDTASDEERKKHDSNLWNMPADPSFVNAYQQAAQMEAMAAQQQAATQQAAAGAQASDGYGQPDDGYGAGAGAGADPSPFGQVDDGTGGDPGDQPPDGQPPQPQPMAKGDRASIRAVYVYDHRR